MNFRAVLVLSETAGFALTHKSMSFIWIVWSTLYVYLWAAPEKKEDGVGPNFASPLQAEKYEKASSPKWHQQSIPTRGLLVEKPR